MKKKEIIEEKVKDAKKKLNEAPQPKTFSEKEIDKLIEYTEDYTPISYVRAKRTLAESY